MAGRLDFIPYAAIERHGAIGDRRTAALVAADGTVDWWCLPDFDGDPIFGAILDARAGGFFRVGPEHPSTGRQRYVDDTAVLETTWSGRAFELVLTDAMSGPETDREEGEDDARVLLRRLRCTRGEARCAIALHPRARWGKAPAVSPAHGGLSLRFDGGGVGELGVFSTIPLERVDGGARAAFELRAGEEAWIVLARGEEASAWSTERAASALEDTLSYWRRSFESVSYEGPRLARVRRSLMITHLLGYAPDGSMVAAPTTSLPERIGGDRNYDYRYSWIRDAALSLTSFALLGDLESPARYLDWLAGLHSVTEAPLQVAYHVSGGTCIEEHDLQGVAGYRGSRPIRIGNRAYAQRQIGSLGYVAESALVFLEEHGPWKPEHGDLVARAADWVCSHWHEPDSGIWELGEHAHYTSSKVMAWVVVDRAVRIAEKTGQHRASIPAWCAARDAIFRVVVERGYCEEIGSFTQRLGSRNVDAAEVLIPLTDMLPPDDPRVVSTIEAIRGTLAIDGLVHRFVPEETPGEGEAPLGEFEGAFFPATFWLVSALARRGRVDEAEELLERVERTSPDLGIFAEEIDARTGAFLGNYPLLFSQSEYLRAILTIEGERRRREKK